MNLPPTDVLLQNYSTDVVEVLERLRHHLKGLDARKAAAACRRVIDHLWPDEADRIQNTHWITTKEHGLRLIRWNKTQRELYRLIRQMEAEGLPVRVIIVKARQLGVSAFIQSLFYDKVASNPNTASMTVNYEDTVTEELFRKAKLIHEMNMGAHETIRSSTGTIEFRTPHNGKFYTMTAGSKGGGRSLTFQRLHASEIPLWPDPEGSMYGLGQSMPLRPGTIGIIESTARGAAGMFFDEWNRASDGVSAYRPFFAPWTWDDEYTLDFPDEAARKTFKSKMSVSDVRYQERYKLTDEQMHWRWKKTNTELLGSEAMFRQEFPITAEEAFLTSGSPVFDPEWIHALRQATREHLWCGDIILANSA